MHDSPPTDSHSTKENALRANSKKKQLKCQANEIMRTTFERRQEYDKRTRCEQEKFMWAQEMPRIGWDESHYFHITIFYLPLSLSLSSLTLLLPLHMSV